MVINLKPYEFLKYRNMLNNLFKFYFYLYILKSNLKPKKNLIILKL